MGFRRVFNRLFSSSRYRLCTAGELKALAAAARSPYEAIARREIPAAIQTIFDVGANIGQTTRELRGLFPAAFIHAFEPTPASRDQFLLQHGRDPRVRLWPYALSDQPGPIEFFVNKRSMTNSLLPSEPASAQWVGAENVENVTTIRVERKTLDEFCAEQTVSRLDILKLDIQGSELDALRGAAGLLERKAIGYICLEAPFLPLYRGQPMFHEIVQFLEPWGYRVYGLFKLARHESDRLLFADALFFREP